MATPLVDKNYLDWLRLRQEARRQRTLVLWSMLKLHCEQALNSPEHVGALYLGPGHAVRKIIEEMGDIAAVDQEELSVQLKAYGH